MSRLSINEMTTYRWPFEEDVAQYVKAGISAVGVWRQKISDFGEDRGLELLADSGLRVSNVLWAGGFTGSDGRSFRESVEDASEAIGLTAALAAGCLVVYTGARAGHTRSHARRLIEDALAELLPQATERNVALALEPMHPACAGEWTFLTSLDETLALITRFESPYLKLAFDTYHLGHDPKTVARIPEFAERVAVVHLGDGKHPPGPEQNRARLGRGDVPLREIVEALEAANYDGFYDVLLIGEDIEAANYGELLCESKRAFQQLHAWQPV